MSSGPKQDDLARLDSVFVDSAVPNRLREIAATSFSTAAQFWQAAFDGKLLSPRLKELILLALHASATSINAHAIKRHVERARTGGASEEEILEVLLSIVGVGNHALYFAVPVLMKELAAAGRDEEAKTPTLRPDVHAIKQDFMETRGFWNEERDLLAGLMPDYFRALSELSMEPWKNGVLTPKEREFVYIAIDCSVTHMYGPGLGIHIRNALKHGATRDEILEVFHLAALMGMEGYILGADALLTNAQYGP
ncbi:carboxymuconolactone decarboxylase family protein [Paraburkholderia sp. NPDC080076]|uniref:carboxymuconolactone decarboxylase family protein n=1 Tax=Paraburkholderia sp. NPDC080076 TaxID=3390605 RepID=UPI003D0749B3